MFNIKIFLLIIVILIAGCTITAPPQREISGKLDEYPTKQLQLLYDNFMLGRLKHYQYDKNIDLVTFALIDQRNNDDKMLDSEERKTVAKAKAKGKLYFTVGPPLFDPQTGDIAKEKGKGVPTSNPLDYFIIKDIARWRELNGAYLTLQDAKWALPKIKIDEKKAHQPWGIIEVDFSPVTYGRPVRVLRVWRFSPGATPNFHVEKVVVYRVRPIVCKLLKPDFRIIYPK